MREAEVQHLHRAVCRDHDVARLEITMNHTRFVRCFHAGCNLHRDLKRIIHRQRATIKTIGQCFAFDVFQHEILLVVGFLDAVDTCDVRVIELRQHLGFALKAREPIGILRQFLRQGFDRDIPLQPRVACEVHHTHPAAPELAGDLVGADLSGVC